jgi:hypothetical protein
MGPAAAEPPCSVCGRCRPTDMQECLLNTCDMHQSWGWVALKWGSKQTCAAQTIREPRSMCALLCQAPCAPLIVFLSALGVFEKL